MNGDIVFYIHGSTIEYSGTLFDAGELTTDILNLAPREYTPLHDQLQHIQSLPGGTRARRTVASGGN